eukprot:s3048_g12.t1
MYTSDQKLDTEISARIGAATSAFAQISRRILTNRHLPCKLRLQLFHSLILSKLYFSIGSWHTPPGRLLQRMKMAVVRMFRKILGASTVAKCSATQILAKAGLFEPRTTLAVERLLYAQRLFHHGPAFLQLMIHEEHQRCDDSWPAGLRHDLQWLYGVESTPDPLLLSMDHSELIDYWQSHSSIWKSRIHRAGRRHLFQESMMLEVQQWHAKIFDVLRQHGFPYFFAFAGGVVPVPMLSPHFYHTSRSSCSLAEGS